MASAGFDFSATYKHEDFPGMALRARHYAQVTEPVTVSMFDWSGDSGEYEVETGEFEYVDDTERVVVVAVGDDARHTVYVDELEKIDREQYCGECGQIGCAHDGLER